MSEAVKVRPGERYRTALDFDTACLFTHPVCGLRLSPYSVLKTGLGLSHTLFTVSDFFNCIFENIGWCSDTSIF